MIRAGTVARIVGMTPAQLAEYESRPEVIARRRHFDLAFDKGSREHADLYLKMIADVESKAKENPR